jgi:paraquat-inducible protein B
MAKEKLTADDALDIAQRFRDLSVRLGDYRFANWDQLGVAGRQELEDAEWSLLNYSSDFVTSAVGTTLDGAEVSLAKLKGATDKAKKATSKLKAIKYVLGVAAAAVALGGAIASGAPGGIALAVGGVLAAVGADGG